MAHIKYYFNQSSVGANAEDVARWLSENAAEYFDSYEVDTSAGEGYPAISCKIGETEALYFKVISPTWSTSSGRTAYIALRLTLIKGVAKEIDGLGGTGVSFSRIKYGIKTVGGVLLMMNDAHNLYITKTNAGDTAVYAKWQYYESTQKQGFFAADLIAGTSVHAPALASVVMASDMTSLGPVCFPGGSYAPALYLTPYTQHKGTPGLIYVDGTVYAYDGYVALKC